MRPPRDARRRARRRTGKAPRVVHVTSAHPPDDPRIFAKECRSLAAGGYDVHLVAPGTPKRAQNGVCVWGVRPPRSGRAVRMTATVAGVLRVALALDADVYHLHDPELIPGGLLLASAGRRVIYDAHEDLPQGVLLKPWIKPRLRGPVARFAAGAERLAARRFAAVIAATPSIEEQFGGYASRAVVISNFPRLEEFDDLLAAGVPKEPAVCYVGSITEQRGARVMVQAIAEVDAALLLAGRFSPPRLRDRLATCPGWSRVVALGQLDRAGVARTVGRCKAGLSVLTPVPTYLTSQPTKVYEYMAASVPVIASNFPLWRTIVEDHGCGLCVDPTDPRAVASAIRWILEHPSEAEAMGRNGRRAVEQEYSWDPEARKLASLYEEVLA
jgi:glycosyltransferase involved in cell wall biosynthesis